MKTVPDSSLAPRDVGRSGYRRAVEPRTMPRSERGDTGRHPRSRALTTRIGAYAAPVLFCVIGVVVLVEANTFGVF